MRGLRLVLAALSNTRPQHQPVLLPVEDEGGEVGRDEGVHPAAGTGQGGVGVEHRGAQGAEHHAAGVDQPDTPEAVGHLERDPDEQLHQQVEHDVIAAHVDQRVGKVSKGFCIIRDHSEDVTIAESRAITTVLAIACRLSLQSPIVADTCKSDLDRRDRRSYRSRPAQVRPRLSPAAHLGVARPW